MRDTERRSRALARRLRGDLTEAELILWSQLNRRTQRSVRFRRQHPIGPYVADFTCISAMVVVEIDGATHGTDDEVAHDARRSAYLAERGWLVVRYTNDEVYRHLGRVLDGIWNAVDQRVRQ